MAALCVMMSCCTMHCCIQESRFRAVVFLAGTDCSMDDIQRGFGLTGGGPTGLILGGGPTGLILGGGPRGPALGGGPSLGWGLILIGMVLFGGERGLELVLC